MKQSGTIETITDIDTGETTVTVYYNDTKIASCVVNEECEPEQEARKMIWDNVCRDETFKKLLVAYERLLFHLADMYCEQ